MSLAKDGYEIVELSAYGMVTLVEARQQLERVLGGSLDTYHERAIGDYVSEHQFAFNEVKEIPREIIDSQLHYFQRLVGMDLHIQAKPYLRISRPGEKQDNIGLHRDTWYGDGPYEISVWIPFTETDEGSALRVAPGSHLWAEAAHPVETYDSGIEKGSPKHALGFAYAPKRLITPVETIPLPMKMGQMLVFAIPLLHGVEINTSGKTRFSMDCRIANSLGSVALSRSRDANYYEPLSVSPLTAVARRYAEANK